MSSAHSRSGSLEGGGGGVVIFSSVQVIFQPNTSRPHLHHPAHQVPFSISEETCAEFCDLLHRFRRSNNLYGFNIPPTLPLLDSTVPFFLVPVLCLLFFRVYLLFSGSCGFYASIFRPSPTCEPVHYFFRVQSRILRVTMPGSYLPLLPNVVLE